MSEATTKEYEFDISLIDSGYVIKVTPVLPFLDDSIVKALNAMLQFKAMRLAVMVHGNTHVITVTNMVVPHGDKPLQKSSELMGFDVVGLRVHGLCEVSPLRVAIPSKGVAIVP